MEVCVIGSVSQVGDRGAAMHPAMHRAVPPSRVPGPKEALPRERSDLNCRAFPRGTGGQASGHACPPFASTLPVTQLAESAWCVHLGFCPSALDQASSSLQQPPGDSPRLSSFSAGIHLPAGVSSPGDNGCTFQCVGRYRCFHMSVAPSSLQQNPGLV